MLALLAGGCLAAPIDRPAPVTASDFRTEQVRRPAIFVRLVFAGPFEDQERQRMLADYEGALLEALNTRAVLANDVRILGEREPRLEPVAAVEKARAVGADHAVSVQVRVTRGGQALFCAETRRPFRAPSTVWGQSVDCSRARRLLDGWQPAVPLREGLSKVYEYVASRLAERSQAPAGSGAER